VRQDLAGRVVLLTGATSGVGRAAAAGLAGRGAMLTIVGRDQARTEATAAALRRETGNSEIDCLIGDLSVRSGMTGVVAGFLGRRDRLDVLVNNAGAYFSRRMATADGIETTFALNHLAYFALTTGLAGLLRNTPGARVVSTSSSAYALGRLDLERVATRVDGPGYLAYCDSKLANVVFTRELARRLAPFEVTANCLHPGFTRSHLFQSKGGPFAYVAGSPLAGLVARAPERAADTVLWLATSPEAASRTGEYFVNRRARKVNRRARDPHLAEGLWALSERLLA
jgi:NAD(P)-dependent dehydrogenase (short-subunit alcohol dehydrogenase family)